MDRRIDGRPLHEGPFGRVGGFDLRVMGLAAKDGSDKALFADLALDRIHIIADARKPFEILLDIAAGLVPPDAELVGQTKGGDAVDNTEIDGLGAAADHRIHPGNRDAEHFRGGHGMDVDAVFKGPP